MIIKYRIETIEYKNILRQIYRDKYLKKCLNIDQYNKIRMGN